MCSSTSMMLRYSIAIQILLVQCRFHSLIFRYSINLQRVPTNQSRVVRSNEAMLQPLEVLSRLTSNIHSQNKENLCENNRITKTRDSLNE